VCSGTGGGSGKSRCIIRRTIPASRNINEKPRKALAKNDQNPGQDFEAGHVGSDRATLQTAMFDKCTVTVKESGRLEANENWKMSFTMTSLGRSSLMLKTRRKICRSARQSYVACLAHSFLIV